MSRVPDELRVALAAVLTGRVSLGAPLAGHTTFRIGGPAEVLVEPESEEEVASVLRLCMAAGVRLHVLGGGSNLLVADGGVRGVVLSTARLAGLRRDPGDATLVHAQAGVATSRLLAAALGWQLAGVEFLAGVPGTVGGGLVMNAGTVLGSFADLVCEVRSLSAAGEPVVRERDACGFVYRGSLLGRGEVVVGARLRLCSGGAAESLTAVRRLFKQRRQREPRGLPSAGSIFKNPDGDFAGRLLEAAGCKGARVGEAEISSVHANWIVNLGAARASDVLALIARARRQVAERCGVDLRLELRCLGDFGGPAELEGALDCCGGFDDAGHGAATGQPGAANQRAAADQRATTGQPAAADQGAAVGQRAAKEAR